MEDDDDDVSMVEDDLDDEVKDLNKSVPQVSGKRRGQKDESKKKDKKKKKEGSKNKWLKLLVNL